jgi:hypothetical protein
MPKLGKKEYPYTPAGKAQYKADKKRQGYPSGGGVLGAVADVLDPPTGGGGNAFAHLTDMRSQTSGLVTPNVEGSVEPQPTAYGSGKTNVQEPLQQYQEGGPAINEQMGEIMPEEQSIMLENEELRSEAPIPDGEMEDNYIDFVINEALMPEEEQYLLDKLGEDGQLSLIFDKVIQTASEFAGSGLVEGPGSAVSDSIPARLSDGEFVMTSKAAGQIGPDNLQGMMDEAELTADIAEEERRVMQAGGYVEEEEEKDEDLRVAIKPKEQEVVPDSMVDKELKKAMLSQSPRFNLFNR